MVLHIGVESNTLSVVCAENITFYRDKHLLSRTLREEETAVASTLSGILIGAIAGG